MRPFTYGMWNIEKFSVNHANKPSADPFGTSGFTMLSVKHMLARIIVGQQVEVMGILEVTLGDGDQAMTLLTQAMNTAASGEDDVDYTMYVSDRNVATSHNEASKADRYGFIYNQYAFSGDSPPSFDKQKGYLNRKPMWFKLTSYEDGESFDFLLWHAPNPNEMGSNGDQQLKIVAKGIVRWRNKNGQLPFILSADFNLNGTSNAFNRLTKIHLAPVFQGVGSMIQTGEMTLQALYALVNANAGVHTVQIISEALLGNSYDNMFYSGFQLLESERLNVPLYFSQLHGYNPNSQLTLNEDIVDNLVASSSKARALSNHCPIFIHVTV